MKILSKISRYYTIAYKMGHYPSLFSLLSSKRKIIAYYGFLGDKNFGDELVYDAAKYMFEPHILLPIRRFMPLSLKVFKTLFPGKIQGVVIGGGTLIRGKLKGYEYFYDLLKSGKPLFIFGTGVNSTIEDPEGWNRLLKLNTFGGVRGPLSIGNLKKIGVDLPVAGDAAFALYKPTEVVSTDKKTILINFGTHLTYEEQEGSRQAIKKFIAYALDLNYEVKFLPFHEIDVELGILLQQEFPAISLLDVPTHYDECVKLFNACDFALGERLHFNVMSLLSECSFLSINYDKKHEDFLASVELGHLGLAMSEVTFEKIKEIFDSRKQTNWPDVRKRVVKLRDFQHQEAQKFIDSLGR